MHISGEWQQLFIQVIDGEDLWMYCIKQSTEYSAGVLSPLLL